MSPSPTAVSFTIAGTEIAPGQSRNILLRVSESYAGAPINIPLRVIRAARPGPTLFVTGGIHGDEINGTGIIRQLILDATLTLRRGTLILVPLVNVLGFEQLSRYLPDRRDLNRAFPGSSRGSLASRYAHTVFTEIVRRCDYGIDLHSAAVRRTNFPNVRADLDNAGARRIALAFGTELIVHGAGPAGSCRRAACKAGCPTILFEAGEVWKIEPSVVETGVRGVRNVLASLRMIDARPVRPLYQAIARTTTWVRARRGGMLHFHVAPGDVVQRDQPLATNTSLLGQPRSVLTAPVDGIVLGMTTLPAVKPGDPVVHLAVPETGLAPIRRALSRAPRRDLAHRTRGDLASSIAVVEHDHHPAELDAPPRS